MTESGEGGERVIEFTKNEIEAEKGEREMRQIKLRMKSDQGGRTRRLPSARDKESKSLK